MTAILSLPVYCSVLLLCCLTSFQNCSNFIVLLYCSLNLLFNISNIPSSLHSFCFACNIVSKSFRPCLPSQFFIIDTLSVWLILKFWGMFFTSILKFHSSAYLSLEHQLNVGCLMMGLLILGPTFSVLAALAMDMVCVTTPVASATACAVYSLAFVFLFSIFASLSDCYCILLLSLPCKTVFFYHLDLMRLPIFSLPTISCLRLPM